MARRSVRRRFCSTVRTGALGLGGLGRWIEPAIDADDLKVVSALTEKLYGDLRRNFFDGFLHFLGGTR